MRQSSILAAAHHGWWMLFLMRDLSLLDREMEATMPAILWLFPVPPAEEKKTIIKKDND